MSLWDARNQRLGQRNSCKEALETAKLGQKKTEARVCFVLSVKPNPMKGLSLDCTYMQDLYLLTSLFLRAANRRKREIQLFSLAIRQEGPALQR